MYIYLPAIRTSFHKCKLTLFQPENVHANPYRAGGISKRTCGRRIKVLYGTRAETEEQRSKRLRKWRERDRARCAAQTASERQATSQQISTHECETMPAKNPKEGDRRLQWMSTNQHERLAVETPKKRERRLQRMSTNQHERLAFEIPEEKDYSG